MTQIDSYNLLGNSRSELNQNFSDLDIRTCIYDNAKPTYEQLFTNISDLSARLSNFTSAVQSVSSDYINTSNLVYNLKDYWLTPVTLVYPLSFSVVANYQDIENWLNQNFLDIPTNQIYKIQFVVKSYSDSLLANTLLEKVSTETLDALSSTYGISTKNIQRFIVLDNIVKTIISSVKTILTRLFIKTQVDTASDLDVLISSCSIHKNVILSSVLTTIDYTNLLSIWSLLQQYSLVKDEYTALSELGINTIPGNVLARFNTKNIYEAVIGSFCYKYDTKWSYIPDCSRNICLNTECSSCYDSIDVNNLYTTDDCKIGSKYVLLECDSVVKDNTKHVFLSSQNFVIPTGGKRMYVKAWGCNGSGDHSPVAPGDPKAYGGGGGYTYAEFDVLENTVYSIAVNKFGGAGITGQIAIGGGLAGVFEGSAALTNTAFNRALVVAGGGGGAVADEDATPSAMFANGLPGNSTNANTSGGALTMSGINAAGSRNANNESAAGGGGYRGGTRYGYRGKGGTGFVNSVGENPVITAGTGISMANQSDSDYSLISPVFGGVVIEIEYETNFILE